MSRWGYPLILALVFTGLVWGTWRKWGHPFVDFGIELYVAWQLSEGKHLYRDIIWLNGPLSQYTNALWFRLFGASYLTLCLANLVLVAALTSLLYRFFTQTIGRTAGFTAGLTFLIAFAFQSYDLRGSWDYIAPYRHEATHGLGLAILGLSVFADHIRHGGKWRLFIVGLCFGGVCLTKIEPTLGFAAALLTGFWLSLKYVPHRRARYRQDLIWFIIGAATLPLGFGLYLAAQMPLEIVAAGMLGGWLRLVQVQAFQPGLYQKIMGLDSWQGKLADMGVTLGWVALAAGILIGLERILRKATRGWRIYSTLGFLGTWLLAYELLNWQSFFSLLPCISGTVLLASALMLTRCSDEKLLVERWIPLVSWGVFALLLLGKLGLSAHIGGYGFTLALPATVLIVTTFTSLLPGIVKINDWGSGSLIRSGSFGVFVVFFLTAGENSIFLYTGKTSPLGAGKDLMLTLNPATEQLNIPLFSFPTAPVMTQLLEDLPKTLPPDATLLCIPEGAVINYFLRIKNPTPYVVFDPVMMAAYGGEERVIEYLAAHPPDYVAFLRRDFTEYGLLPFGKDPHFARSLVEWLARHYEIIQVYGRSTQNDEFGVALLRRKAMLPENGP
ncbi:MAG: hypothetical protein ACUVR8_11490 [Acidobacteriota bacterium]